MTGELTVSSAKSFWQKPEGTAGKVVIGLFAAALLLTGILIYL